MDSSFVVCDLETTGLNPFADKIIEIGLVRLEDGQISGNFHTLVNPNQSLNLKIKRLTGLDDRDLSGAPVLSEVLPEALDFIRDSSIAGHNIDFDLGFLAAARGEPLRNPSYDTLELARLVVPDSSSFRLSALCRYFDIELKAGHRALDDAVATARLLTVLLQKFREADINVLNQLIKLLAEARSKWHGFAVDVAKELLKVFPDKKISANPYWRKDGMAFKETKPREKQNEKEKNLLDPVYVASLVGKEGALLKAIAGYEYRPQQEAMVGEVAEAFNEEKYLMLEAGTGVGKSMAYLIPAVLWSLKNRERVLVATHTLNLQEQLWLKDIPVLAGVINQQFRASLAKGRQNYICLRRWFNTLNGLHQPDEAAFFARVLTWLALTKSGDRTELNATPGEGDYWLSICGDAENCLGTRCRYRMDCFVNKARKAVEEADLVITNHSLLFLDIRNENRVLPAYGPLIIDEAHHLEDSATNHLGRQVNQSLVNRWLNITGKTLSRLTETIPPGDREQWEQVLRAAMQIRLETVENARLFFQTLGGLAANKSNGSGINYQSNRTTLRLPVSDNRYRSIGEELINLLRTLSDAVKKLSEFMDLWSISAEVWTEQARDLLQIAQSGLALTDELFFILESADEEFVYWVDIEFFAGGMLKHCSLSAVPINVGEMLYKLFYKNKKTVVFTSATLSVNGTFAHFIERVGLDYLPAGRLAEAHFDSPFIYERQALLCINRDLPVQGEVADELYLEKLENILAKLIGITHGKTLVLFTSHMILRETYNRLKPKLENMDIYLLGHGIDGSRTRILEEFRSSERAVLFGASSFWEGVDVPGEALTCVVMVKLPFLSPKVPVIEARLEDLARKERDGFKTFSVPQAVIRFKQGFGRLIRSGSDRGCVVVLDARILKKSYGRQFLRALPLKNHIRGGTDMITKKLSDWFSGGA